MNAPLALVVTTIMYGHNGVIEESKVSAHTEITTYQECQEKAFVRYTDPADAQLDSKGRQILGSSLGCLYLDTTLLLEIITAIENN